MRISPRPPLQTSRSRSHDVEAFAGPLGPREAGSAIGPFILVQPIGRGGFAPVWLARETYGDAELRTVALKIFYLDPRTHAAASPDTRRVIEEARALCRVEHPNVVRFYSIVVDRAQSTMGLAMEYLHGTPLDRKLKEQGRLSVIDAVRIGLCVASALAAVHRGGVVHRDVKPANIVETDATYKLIDFGIALGAAVPKPVSAPLEVDDVPVLEGAYGHAVSVRGATTERRDIAGLVGTVGYIDPECLSRGSKADALGDLYALGATLFQLITGVVPALSGGVLRGDVLGGRRRAPSLLDAAPSVPRELGDLVDKLLSPARDDRPRSADWVATRLQQILSGLAGQPRELPPESVGPFRGLARFEVSDRGVYFGRTLEVAQALQILRVRGIVAFLGASGSGKSSLARAGVLPAVIAGELGIWPDQWDAVIAVPGVDPREELLRGVRALLGDLQAPSPGDLVAELANRVERTGRGIILLVDQLEELATLARSDARDWIVELLGILREQPLPGIRAVVSARRDLLDPLLGISGLGRALLHNAILVEPMTPPVWAEALERALAAYGYTWENEDLRRRVAAEIDRTASAMPLVQFALARLWERRDGEQKLLTWRAYQEMGGIAGALAQHAETTLAALQAEGGEAAGAARRALLALSTPQGTRAARELSALERLAGPRALAILERFEQARLVIRLPGGYTLAHEALLTEWRRLERWLAEARDARVIVEQLEQDAERWSGDREAVPVWRRRRLAVAREALEREGLELSGGAAAFFRAGMRADRRRLLGIATAAAVGAAIVVGASGLYLRAVETERARTEAALRRERASRVLAEDRARDVQAAQLRIDELLRGMADSSAKSEVQALQARIRDAEPRARPESAVRAPPAAPRAAPAASEPSPVTSARPHIQVQNEW